MLAEYSPTWPLRFVDESRLLCECLPNAVVEHIGSTAVDGLVAKPVIDIMLGVKSLADVVRQMQGLRGLGYQYVAKYESTIPERRYFVKSVTGQMPVHLHAVILGSLFWSERLAFRDALRGDPQLVNAYATLKRELEVRYRQDRAAYTNGKGPFIRGVVAQVERPIAAR